MPLSNFAITVDPKTECPKKKKSEKEDSVSVYESENKVLEEVEIRDIPQKPVAKKTRTENSNYNNFDNADKRNALLEMMGVLAAKIMLDEDHKLRSVVDDILTLIRLVKAYFKKEYRDISTTDIVLILGGLIYVITPLDFIPDIGPV